MQTNHLGHAKCTKISEIFDPRPGYLDDHNHIKHT